MTERLTRWRTRLAQGSEALRERSLGWRERATRVVSPLGWWVIGLAIVSAALGWLWGWDEFRVIALMTAAVAVLALLWLIGRTSYGARVDLGNRRVRVGETALGRVVMSNPGQKSIRPSYVEFVVGRNAALFRVPTLGPGEQHEEMFQLPARRRSVIELGPVSSVRADPLGLYHRRRHWADPVELFIHPAMVMLDASAIGFLRDIEGVTTQNLSSSDVSFHALRDYVPGDDRRSIHWRTTARTGRLMVRQFEETMRAHLLLLLSLRPQDYATEDDFEMAVSAVASIGHATVREGRQLTVITTSGPLPFSGGMNLLDELCRIEQASTAKPLRTIAAEAARACPDASVLGMVTGSMATPADLRAMQLQFSPDVQSFGLRCGADLERARRRTSTLVVLDAATLEDVARGMRTLV